MEKGACFDKNLLEQIEEESKTVCRFSNCTQVTSELLKSLGYVVEVRGDSLLIKDYAVVKSVEFHGLSDFRDVEKVVKFLLLGKPISESAVESVKQLIHLKLKSFGFSRSKVSVSLEKKGCGYVAVVSVEKGAPLIVKTVSVEAPPQFKKIAIRLFKTLLGRPLNYQKLLDLKDALENSMVSKGYYNCSVSFRFVPSGKGIDLYVQVNPGKLYRVVFSGNSHFPSDKLKSLVTFPSARSVDEFEIENSKKQIEKFYRNHGFPFVKVSSSVLDKGKVVVLKFNIDEGPYVIVKKIDFKGITPDRKLYSSLLSRPFSEASVNSLVERLVSELKEKGYREAKGGYRVELPATLLIEINRGPLFKIVSVKVSGDRIGCFKGVELPFPYTESEVEKITGKISDCYASRGYPDVKLQTETLLLSKTGSEADLELKIKIDSGRQYRFGYVVIKGLKRTGLSAVKNLIVVSPGELYSREKVVKQYSRLLDSRLFSSVNINEVRSDSTVSEVIDLQEGSFLRAKGFFGYGTDYGAVTNGFLTMTSPFGMGLKFFLFGRYRQKEGYDAVFKVLKPAFPFKNWNSGYSIVKKEQIYESFKSVRVLYSFSLERKKTKSFSQTFKIEVSRENLRDTSISARRFNLERRFTYLQTYDRRDSISNPKKGYLSFTKFSLAGLFLGGDSDYTLFEEKFLYLKSFSGFTAAVRAGTGFISSLKGSSVPIQDRFFLGGAESVRGYKYGTISPTDNRGNYVGGKAYGLFSVELRHGLYDHLEGALFYDAGRVFREPSDFKLSNWYASLGFGLRYLTPVGPLRIDYGYKLKPVPGQGRGRFHISFGFPF